VPLRAEVTTGGEQKIKVLQVANAARAERAAWGYGARFRKVGTGFRPGSCSNERSGPRARKPMAI